MTSGGKIWNYRYPPPPVNRRTENINFASRVVINNQNICFKYNIAQLYFILGRAELHRNFSSIPKDGSDIHRFSNSKWVLAMCIAENPLIPESSLSQSCIKICKQQALYQGKHKLVFESTVHLIDTSCLLLHCNRPYTCTSHVCQLETDHLCQVVQHMLHDLDNCIHCYVLDSYSRLLALNDRTLFVRL